ncbi:hypothetical protein ABZ401_19185 [Streptomyces sp. NPDC005892]|uniref:hypothetical protein n=1 Tax=Streptomyces sp. NPDC005892 TaxID=3155593 RepID=UPI0033EE50AA
MTTPTTWPEGVIARYLTVGGATVDIAQTTRITRAGTTSTNTVGDLTLTTRCSGCADSDQGVYEGLYLDLVEPVLANGYSADIRDWAQAHAETCRAMPKPIA